MQVSRSPTARWTSAAATAESTPPDSAQMTCPSEPVFAGVGVDPLADVRDGRVDEVAAVHDGSTPAMPTHEIAQDVLAARRVDDLGMELDAVEVRGPAPASPANGVESVWAVGAKPSGSRVMESPWLIQTGCSRLDAGEQPSPVVIVTLAGPYSRWSNGMTSPPSSRAMSCAP